MTTIKLLLAEPIEITDYQKQFTNVVHFAYNRWNDSPSLKSIEVEWIIKRTMKNIDLLDASFIHNAVDDTKSIDRKKVVIFGGKENWERYNKKLITKEEFQANRLRNIYVRGEKGKKGNRKFQLNVIENNCVIFKPKKGIKIVAKLPKTKHYKTLKKLQVLCEDKKAYFNCRLTNNEIYIQYDETIFCNNEYKPVNKRILSIDSNPNYIAYVIMDGEKVLCKNIIDLKDLNKQSTNKKKHEDYEIVKRIMNDAVHYKVKHIVYEDLSIKPKDLKKGRNCNRICNNNWRRRRFFENLIKHCNIIGIHTQDVYAQYSSFKGQIDNPNEYDSVAAALELNRRGSLFLRKYYYNENIDIKGQVIGIDQKLSVDLGNRWKKELDVADSLDTYRSLYRVIKNAKYSYRNLFHRDKTQWSSFRLKSKQSFVFVHSP